MQKCPKRDPPGKTLRINDLRCLPPVGLRNHWGAQEGSCHDGPAYKYARMSAYSFGNRVTFHWQCLKSALSADRFSVCLRVASTCLQHRTATVRTRERIMATREHG